MKGLFFGQFDNAWELIVTTFSIREVLLQIPIVIIGLLPTWLWNKSGLCPWVTMFCIAEVALEGEGSTL